MHALQEVTYGSNGILCRVNGISVKETGFETHAVFGHATAQDCAILGSQQQAYCGDATELSLVPAGPLAPHRTFLGSEKVHAHVRGRRPDLLLSLLKTVGMIMNIQHTLNHSEPCWYC